jgi:hypothetical protein
VDGDPESTCRHLQAYAYIPPILPPVSAAVFGTDGSIWVGRERLEDGAPVRWEVYDPDGEHLFDTWVNSGDATTATPPPPLPSAT